MDISGQMDEVRPWSPDRYFFVRAVINSNIWIEPFRALKSKGDYSLKSQDFKYPYFYKKKRIFWWIFMVFDDDSRDLIGTNGSSTVSNCTHTRLNCRPPLFENVFQLARGQIRFFSNLKVFFRPGNDSWLNSLAQSQFFSKNRILD